MHCYKHKVDWRSMVLAFLALPSGSYAAAQAPQASSSLPLASITAGARETAGLPSQAGAFDKVIDRAVAREHLLLARMRNLHPMAETYLQIAKAGRGRNASSVKDQYFLGRLDMSDGDVSLVGLTGHDRSYLRKMKEVYSLQFEPVGFAQMVALDTDLDKKNYNFTYVRREFLGDVRCIIIDVRPKANAPRGKFQGRAWVEDQDFNIVRFNGTYLRPQFNSFYVHFDSWRGNVRPGVWLPSVVYSEESSLKNRYGHLGLKAQTRLWDYDVKRLGNQNQEFTQILVDSQQAKDATDKAADPNPIVAERLWQQQAENNIVERLEKVGILAPRGEVDSLLETIVNNLVVTNGLSLPQDVRCRVLITTPLESFTIGNTIILSRGLIDVLPNEASLAMVLSHELSHIVLGHRVDTQLAFYDRMFESDQRVLKKLKFKRDPAEENAANAKALELLKRSPYQENLAAAGVFLRALQQRAPEFPNLIRPHAGNGLPAGANTWVSALVDYAPPLDPQSIDQIAALPLGGRIKLDPWSSQIQLAQTHPVVIALGEKMPFEITPFFPYLTRLSDEDRAEDRAKDGSSGGGSK